MKQVHACVYPPPENVEVLTSYVSKQLAQAKLNSSIQSSITIEGSGITVSFSLNSQVAHVSWELSEECDYRSVLISPEHSWMRGLNLESFAKDFPLTPTTSSSQKPTPPPQVESGLQDEETFYPLPPHTLAILWLFILLTLWRLEQKDTRASLLRWLGILPVLALLLWGMVPELAEPFSPLSSKFRILGSMGSLFFDPGHPFLFFLLNSPIVQLSSEPHILRTLPFLFVIGEAILLFVTASRHGGILGGVLASSWFVLEVPRRHGLYDFSGWDLAGLFLLAQVYWLQNHANNRLPQPKACAGLILLVLGGLSSSWLMIAPAFVIAFVLTLKWRAKPQMHWFLFAMVFVTFFGFVWMWISTSGNAFPSSLSLAELFRDIAKESPFGRTPYMTAFICIGGLWLLYERKNTTLQFVLLAIIGTILAIVLSCIFLNTAQGYYAGLITPLLLFAAGAGVARSCNWLYSHCRSSGHGAFACITTLFLLLGLISATLTWPQQTLYSANRWGQSVEEFAFHLQREPGHVLTNYSHFGLHLDFERARLAGDLKLASNGPSKTVFKIVAEECQSPGKPLEHQINLPTLMNPHLSEDNPWYLVLYYLFPKERTRCLEAFHNADCIELVQSDGRHHYYQCNNKI